MPDQKQVTLTIDGTKITVNEGTTILEAAKQAGIDIPTLCFLKEINEMGDCRMCIVEVEGRRGFATSCIQKVDEGMIDVYKRQQQNKVFLNNYIFSQKMLFSFWQMKKKKFKKWQED